MHNGGHNRGLKYEPPRYACPGSMIPMQHMSHPHPNLHQSQFHQPIQQQLAQRAAPPVPSNRPYMKPLPKLPPNIDEGTERSSTEDISSRPYSPSLSSSNEDILKPTANLGDRGDCSGSSVDMLNARYQTQPDPEWLLRAGFGGGKINSIDLAYLKDLDISSTTESHAPSTLPPNNKEVESCTSFEYHQSGIIKSPFQREIKRLLESSASKIPVPISRATSSTITTATNPINYNNLKSYSNGLNGHQNNNCSKATARSKYEFESMEKPNNYLQVTLGGAGAAGGNHPVGLEAIREIAKHTTASDSSQM